MHFLAQRVPPACFRTGWQFSFPNAETLITQVPQTGVSNLIERAHCQYPLQLRTQLTLSSSSFTSQNVKSTPESTCSGQTSTRKGEQTGWQILLSQSKSPNIPRNSTSQDKLIEAENQLR